MTVVAAAAAVVEVVVLLRCCFVFILLPLESGARAGAVLLVQHSSQNLESCHPAVGQRVLGERSLAKLDWGGKASDMLGTLVLKDRERHHMTK